MPATLGLFLCIYTSDVLICNCSRMLHAGMLQKQQNCSKHMYVSAHDQQFRRAAIHGIECGGPFKGVATRKIPDRPEKPAACKLEHLS